MKSEKALIDEEYDKVAEVVEKTNYWFVRTDYGEYFDTYVENGFIAIGWNYITLEELVSQNNDDSIRKKITLKEEMDETQPGAKRMTTSIINKLRNFINLKKGDVIIIPSRNSSRYAFGIIKDSQVFIDINKSYDCEYYKRKGVQWITVKTMQELDPNFYRMRFTQHSISHIEEYSQFIDNIINPVYRKNNNIHFVIDIRSSKDINVDTLISLINNIQELIRDINKEFDLNEQINSNSIRLNLQSPGLIEIKSHVGKSLVVLVLILSLTCCERNINTTPQMNRFIETKSDTIELIKQAMEELEVDKDKINTYTYGVK